MGCAGHPHRRDAEPRRARRARHALHRGVHDLPDLRAGARGVRRRASTCTRSATGTTPTPTTARSRAGTTCCARAATRSSRSASCTSAGAPGDDHGFSRRDRADARRRRDRRREGPGPRRHSAAQGRRQDGEARRPGRVAVHASTTATSRAARRSGCTRRRRARARQAVGAVRVVRRAALSAHRAARVVLPLLRAATCRCRSSTRGRRAPDHPYLRDYARVRRLRHALRERRATSKRATRRLLRARQRRSTSTSARCCARCDASGLAADTRVVYTSDHGDNLGARGLWGKSTLYEESAGVPLIVAGDGVPADAVRDAPASHVDVFPFVFECVGAPVPDDDGHPGVSLARARRGRDARSRRASASTTRSARSAGAFMLRDGNYKYMHYVAYRPQLFDLARDPEELVDVAGDPAYADDPRALPRAPARDARSGRGRRARQARGRPSCSRATAGAKRRWRAAISASRRRPAPRRDQLSPQSCDRM